MTHIEQLLSDRCVYTGPSVIFAIVVHLARREKGFVVGIVLQKGGLSSHDVLVRFHESFCISLFVVLLHCISRRIRSGLLGQHVDFEPNKAASERTRGENYFFSFFLLY